MNLPADIIANDVRDLCLNTINHYGHIIWDSWPWDNTKLFEFSCEVLDGGVVVLPELADVVRAVRIIGKDGEAKPLFNQDEILAARYGEIKPSEKYWLLPDYRDEENGGNWRKRIQVNDSLVGQMVSILALQRWLDFIIDPNYDATNPAKTPMDYRVAKFPIDRALPALKEYVMDALRMYQGEAPTGAGPIMTKQAIEKETLDAQREQRITPFYSMFSDVGNWW